jgi:hypothetical protein
MYIEQFHIEEEFKLLWLRQLGIESLQSLSLQTHERNHTKKKPLTENSLSQKKKSNQRVIPAEVAIDPSFRQMF